MKIPEFKRSGIGLIVDFCKIPNGHPNLANWIPLKIGRAPITDMISDTYHTVSVKPYWELTHQENPNIHCTPR
jgi:hypothetical protein